MSVPFDKPSRDSFSTFAAELFDGTIGNGRMNTSNAWHKQDQFWELFEPFLFDEDRQSNARLEVENVINLLRMRKGQCVLDLCCGIGRHSLELARQGFDVVGVDRTASFNRKAMKVADESDLKIEFVTADMKEYIQADRFDVVKKSI